MPSNCSSHITVANRKLKDKTPAEWIEDIKQLPFQIQDCIAKIVWWDWLSGRKIAERCEEFDPYLKFSDLEFPEKEILKGLLAVGYTEWQATSRLGRGRGAPSRA